MKEISALMPEIKVLYETGRKSHDWDHIQRVYHLCMTLARGEKVNLLVLQLAALLHDAARQDEDRMNGGICHAEAGAFKAQAFLESHGFEEETISGVVHCIETHRYKNHHEPQTIEAKILYDADKLDAIGAIGLGRAFVYAGEIGARVHNKDVNVTLTHPYTSEDTAYREYLVKLQHIHQRMLTEKGQQMAQDRHRFMEQFFNRLNKEVAGDV
jgi:uncharacterized protein